MNASAIIMMIIAVGIVWGGLVAAILFLRARPTVTDGPWVDDPDEEYIDPEHGEAPLRRDT